MTKSKRPDARQIRAMVTLYDEQVSCAEIGRRLGFNEKTVTRCVREAKNLPSLAQVATPKTKFNRLCVCGAAQSEHAIINVLLGICRPTKSRTGPCARTNCLSFKEAKER